MRYFKHIKCDRESKIQRKNHYAIQVGATEKVKGGVEVVYQDEKYFVTKTIAIDKESFKEVKKLPTKLALLINLGKI